MDDEENKEGLELLKMAIAKYGYTRKRFDSQEREKSSRRISSLPPVVTNNNESQLQLSRTSNNIVWPWGTASA